MTRILVIDDQEIFRVPLAAWLRQEGYDAITAGTGAEAFGHLRTSQVDLVLFDFSMRGQDGMALLTRLRSDKRWSGIPVIILTSVAEKQQIISAARLGIRDYILKSRFSMKEMLGRIKRLIDAAQTQAGLVAALQSTQAGSDSESAGDFDAAASAAEPISEQVKSLPALLTRQQSLDRARAALEPRNMAAVLAQVMTLAHAPRDDAQQMADLISADAALTARVMRAANSAPYAIGAGTVASIPQAVSQVGVTSARNIAAAMGIYDALRIGDESAFNPIRCWQHSLAAGALCEQLYGEDADLPPGIPYLVGLCHDVGEIVLQTCFGPEFTQVLSAAARLDKPIGQIESAMLGVTHGELAQLAFELMGLPDSIRRPIQTMHDRASTTTRTRLGSAVRLADMYANGLLLSSSGRELIVAVTQAECRATTGQPHPAVPDGERFRAEMFALTTMLARLSPADEEKFTKPYYARTKHPVCLVRDPGLSRFDPITAAAMALADTTVMEKLPDRPMAGGLLIVVTGAADASGFSAEAIAKVADPARTLWLTRRSDAAAANPPALAEAPIQPVNMPVPIEALAAFIRKGAAAADTARQAAA